MTKQEQKARELISKQTMSDLLNYWEWTTTNNHPNIADVRGWLMDEFEKRNPQAFEKWLDENAKDEDLRNYM